MRPPAYVLKHCGYNILQQRTRRTVSKGLHEPPKSAVIGQPRVVNHLYDSYTTRDGGREMSATTNSN
eukprot:2713521-Pleurochrysis_carterae.AAC.2